MEVKIQTIHFEATEKLQDYVQKRVSKLERFSGDIRTAEVTLKVVKPESAMNKEVIIKITEPQQPELVANKTADSFEEAVDNAMEALDRQLEKRKDK